MHDLAITLIVIALIFSSTIFLTVRSRIRKKQIFEPHMQYLGGDRPAQFVNYIVWYNAKGQRIVTPEREVPAELKIVLMQSYEGRLITRRES